jgi:hypothetical protein
VLRIQIRYPGLYYPGIRDKKKVFFGSQIPTPYSESLVTIFWCRKYCNSLISSNLLKYIFKNIKILNLVKFVAPKKVRQQNVISPLLFVVVGSGIQDPG